MAGTVISSEGASEFLASRTCSRPPLVRMTSLTPWTTTRMCGSSSSFWTASISVKASSSSVSSAAVIGPRSISSLVMLPLRPSGPKLNVVTRYILVLEHKHGVVAEPEEKVARREVGVVQLAVDVGELDEVRGDRVAGNRGDDDHGRVVVAALRTLGRPLVE